MIEPERLSVAVPWSLSHYILMNGFHPLYRALFDQRPGEVALHAWDNADLAELFEKDRDLLARVLKHVRETSHVFTESTYEIDNANRLQRYLRKLKHVFAPSPDVRVLSGYIDQFWQPNVALSELLPGDVELHHTAPYPTMSRPFVFHCEALAPVFFPFAHQGTGTFKLPQTLRSHYRKIFAGPLCLGIFSHLPETLHDLSKFFGDPVIDGKLFQSRIGLSEHSFPTGPLPDKKPLTEPRFVFLNSAHQKSGGFFTRGGDIVLRFWKEFRALGRSGRLFMRCGRPEDRELRSHGVDVDFLRSEENRSVLWVDNYLTNQELNALLAEAHFFLLPSWSLHSASIMQAMAMGAVPVVSDTLGTSHYVADDDNGIVLEGVFAANWHTDPETGILIDQYRRNPALNRSLVSQLTRRITALVAAPQAYERLRQSALSRSRSTFSGRAFSEDFWSRVRTLHEKSPASVRRNMPAAKLQADLAGCLIDDSQWQTIFESTCQPVLRLFTGYGRVTELGGVFIADDNSAVRHHDWSVLAKYVRSHLSQRSFAHSIRELDGVYLPECSDFLLNRIVNRLFELLRPVPPLHRFSLNMFRWAKRARNKLRRMKPDNYAGPVPVQRKQT